MDSKHYHMVPKPESSGFSDASLEGARVCLEQAVRPDNPSNPIGEWMCPNRNCVVDSVLIMCTIANEMPPCMRCPVCSTVLEFYAWLCCKLFVPVKEGRCAPNP